jgi:hypothetical protein
MSVTLIKSTAIVCTYRHIDEKVFKRAEFLPEELEGAIPNNGI